ncbi:hypothetical protein [Streptomyces puniciscabiei]|uniref:hypothetical protein n=1 Tax=Streptomyces puniciscabiei TaxID=164348 RepID=UPI00131B7A00|nr:hypothetical protein [Streptomyces puniciscabiei]
MSAIQLTAAPATRPDQQALKVPGRVVVDEASGVLTAYESVRLRDLETSRPASTVA